MRIIIAFIGLLAGSAISMSAAAPYELRGRKSFENEIDAHSCQELFIQGRSRGWINAPQEASADLIAKQCVADSSPSASTATSVGSVYGDVREGWYVIALRTGSVRPLKLPALGAFSNPSFCGRYAAYWANQADSTWSLAVADLDSGALVKEVAVGKLDLETDDVHVLPAPGWNKACTEAVFERQGFVKKTSVVVKSNNSLQRP
jgi:hypothetical protein